MTVSNDAGIGASPEQAAPPSFDVQSPKLVDNSGASLAATDRAASPETDQQAEQLYAVYQMLMSSESGLAAACGIVDRILTQWASREPDPSTSSAAALAPQLAMVVGTEENAMDVLVLIASCFENGGLPAGAVTEEVGEFPGWLTEMTAVHGQRVYSAILLDGLESTGWRKFARYVYREIVANIWRINVVLTLNDQSEVAFRDSPENITLLAEALLDTLVYMPHDALIETVPVERRQALGRVFQTLMDKFAEGTAPGEFEPAIEQSKAAPADAALTPVFAQR